MPVSSSSPVDGPRAVVIGAGVGGLTAAVALHQRGWHVTVLERAPAIEAVGAGLGLTPNSLRALDMIGLGDTVRSMRSWNAEGGLRTPSGRWLSRTSQEAAAERFGGPLVPLHRATLISLLRSRLPESAVVTGAEAEIADPGDADRPARIRRTVAKHGTAGLAAGKGGVEHEPSARELPQHEAELAVAADGVHSAARSLLFPGCPAPRNAGFTAWRFVVPAPDVACPPHETWGRGVLWGTQPLHDGRIYAYAAAAVPAGERSPDGELAELRRRFGTWHQPVPGLLAAARPDDVLRNDVYEAAEPLPAYHRGRVAVLGDAAHAMPPTLGQGGNQAMEDAVVLAHHATTRADIPSALAAYTHDRLPRTSEVVHRAIRVSRFITLTSATACALRDAAMVTVGRLAPHLALRALDGIADWSPPGHGGDGKRQR
ncbi:FAD-dependent monooxygenase [Streptomyces marispadix]|uniref:FAD-dependent oxidoreductase n=1 Tax=Streptomyces marispadix TaxID=2922868 RepID=A0ABS9SRS3_9ACTN|nr:FAD-dependent monooxygenase [Streptomyces marispadix]MCH6158980.1 FAD-dependent oxidoreductase [Streptomyces marispadix]